MANSKKKPLRRFQCRPVDILADPAASAESVVSHLNQLRGGYDLLTLDTDPARITSTDILAVSALGTPVPIPAALWLLGDEGQWLTTEILAKIDTDAKLWACPPESVHELATLYHLVRQPSSQAMADDPKASAMGQATATRILAAKRPRLVPIAGSASRRTLGYRKDDEWWRRWRLELDNELVEHAQRIRDLAADTDERAAKLSELRVLDIALRAAP